MNTIGSHPGAILFRLSIMIILITIMIVVFFSYLDDTERELERASILQTKAVIESSLALVFATYAVKQKLDQLNQVDGGNPFVLLTEFEIQLPAYRGEIEQELSTNLVPGWYYLKHRGLVAYKSRFIDMDSYYRVKLRYRDANLSGRFEPGVDQFESLRFVKTAEL